MLVSSKFLKSRRKRTGVKEALRVFPVSVCIFLLDAVPWARRALMLLLGLWDGHDIPSCSWYVSLLPGLYPRESRSLCAEVWLVVVPYLWEHLLSSYPSWTGIVAPGSSGLSVWNTESLSALSIRACWAGVYVGPSTWRHSSWAQAQATAMIYMLDFSI